MTELARHHLSVLPEPSPSGQSEAAHACGCGEEESAITRSPVHSSLGATVNPITLCAPLGAVLATAGVARSMTLLHGGQGCATYIRRYIISHFREPMDVASSSFAERDAVFGGEGNFGRAIENLQRKYAPALVTAATTCVAETIGEDLRGFVNRLPKSDGCLPPVVPVNTPSYKDGHVEGFHATVLSLVSDLVAPRIGAEEFVNVLPPIVSPEDLRHLREIVESFDVQATLLPDYSATLDAPIQDAYQPLPEGGTPVAQIRGMANAKGTIDLTLPGRARGAGEALAALGNERFQLGLPIGVRATDALLDVLEGLTGRGVASWLEGERGRLLDSYADGHKYVFGKRVAVYGDPELVAAMAGFLEEIGAVPVLCATGARNQALSTALARLTTQPECIEDGDFVTMEAACRRLAPELLIGNSKGYRIARELGVPLLRFGFPIHDRLGASRLLSVGYRGTQRLFDSVVNSLLAAKQDASSVGFAYL